MIAISIPTKPLGNVAKVISGYAFKSAEFCDEGIPVIKIKNIRVGTVDLDDAAYVAERFLKLDAKYHVGPGDLLISLTGSHPNQPNSVVGRVARMGAHQTSSLLNQRAGKIFLREKDSADLNYLYYVLSSPKFRNAVAMLANGAASQANVSPTQAESLKIPLPDLPTQRRIAGILSAYDDLIENNLRRIRILEEMAQSLYREWFVHFRFPGHESVPLTDSPLGPIPQGWEVKKVKDVLLRLKAGEVYKQADVSRQGIVPVIDQSTDEVLGYHDREPAHVASIERPIAIFGDHTCKMQLMITPFSIGPNVVPFIAKVNRPLLYVYYLIQNLATTQEYKRHWTQLNSNKVPVSTEILSENFATFCQPILDSIEQLKRRNQTLRQTRALLLPKLVTQS